MNSITRGSAFIRAKGSRSDSRQRRRIRRSVVIIGVPFISTKWLDRLPDFLPTALIFDLAAATRPSA